MSGPIIIDTNLLLLLVVGSARKSYISMHKRLKRYGIDDFNLVVELVGEYSEILLLPHILAEVSTFLKGIAEPARRGVREAFAKLIEGSVEVSVASIHGVRREEFMRLDLTDAVVLHFLAMHEAGIQPTLLTADEPVANAASACGYDVFDYNSLVS